MLSVILFIVCFCLALIALYEPEAENLTTVDNFENFYSAVMEVTAPEIEIVAESPQGQNQAETRPTEFSLADSANTVPNIPDSAESTELNPQFTIRQLREQVRQQNLQSTIKKQLGKSVNSCRKEELLSVLFA